MRSIIILTTIFLSYSAFSQKGDELLVYSLKGNVTVIENNTESKVKIGKVLKPGATIKTQKLAKLTMVCKQGKPISVTKEGSFPVTRWKDSCTSPQNSMTTKYFQYIWDQLYVRSDEYKREHASVETPLTDAPVRGNEEFGIVPNFWLDTIYYSAGEFPLTWTTTKPYSGKYFFVLRNLKTKAVVFSDSLAQTSTSLEKIKKSMRAGNVYVWSIITPASSEIEGGIINYITSLKKNREITRLKNLAKVVEEPADQFFRVAYLLQELRYSVDALLYYQKAAEAAPENLLYSEKLGEYKKQFGIY